jgi:membrane-bound inhibitor of C-type lysozyme
MLRRTLLMALVAAGVLVSLAPASAQTFFSYRCRDGTRFAAAFYSGVRVAYLRLDGKTMTLARRVSASGRRYWRSGITLRVRGKAATLTRSRQSTECIRN